MPKTRYGQSPWQQGVAKNARPWYPRLNDDHEIPVVIVGGGLTGTITAYTFAAAGIRVVLLEAARLGSGSTGRSAGLVLSDPEGDFLVHEAAHGRRAARAMWQATRRAALDLAATIRRLRMRCGLSAADSVLLARNREDVRRLKREADARRGAGLEATWLTGRALATLKIEADGAIRTRGHARIDPYRACLGFGRAALARGASIFEQTVVRRVTPRSKHVEVITPKGVVRCDTVVLATGEPSLGFGPLRRHFATADTYMVLTPPLPAAVRNTAPGASLMVRDRHEPPHRLCWVGDDRLIWNGADQPRGPTRVRDKVLVQRGGQLMYELSLLVPSISGVQPEYAWDAPSARTHDGLPFIGPHRNYPRHLFALGLGGSLAGSFLAARILLRQYTSHAEKADEHFGFARLPR